MRAVLRRTLENKITLRGDL